MNQCFNYQPTSRERRPQEPYELSVAFALLRTNFCGTDCSKALGGLRGPLKDCTFQAEEDFTKKSNNSIRAEFPLHAPEQIGQSGFQPFCDFFDVHKGEVTDTALDPTVVRPV
jgi:hypothetical protein